MGLDIAFLALEFCISAHLNRRIPIPLLSYTLRIYLSRDG